MWKNIKSRKNIRYFSDFDASKTFQRRKKTTKSCEMATVRRNSMKVNETKSKHFYLFAGMKFL